MDSSTTTDQIRAHITIYGAVQGVGFRPFVVRMATVHHLAGYVINDTAGVVIEVEGTRQAVEAFVADMYHSPHKPPPAVIHHMHTEWLPPTGDNEFVIRHSATGTTRSAVILPDIATCAACLHELTTPTDRRVGYPFITCTYCGPRFSIIEALPYDRHNTTMRHFTMCPDCQTEYDDTTNRRFHAQPNGCSVCGPRLTFTFPAQPSCAYDDEHALLQTAVALRDGQIVALKGLGGFQLLVDARNNAAVMRLRERKHRPAKPFALMVCHIEQARTLCVVSPDEAALLASPEAPIVILQRVANAPMPIADAIAPDTNTLGVMLPYTPLHHLLMRELGFPIVATSGNLSEEPICIDEQDAYHRLAPIADCFLVHNRPIARHVDDSIAWMVAGTPQLVRRARGYAPLPLRVSGSLPTILAVGGHLKNSIAVSIPLNHQTTQVVVSQHIGNLDTLEARVAFERVIDDLCRMYDVSPTIIAHDMHPDYFPTHYAQARAQRDGRQCIAVQHHHAHLAACLADNNSNDAVALGIIWDGTGYGADGTIWGGEWLLGNATSYQRIAHFAPFVLPGGDAAVREPQRTALALLWACYGDTIFTDDTQHTARHIPLFRTTSATTRTHIHMVLQRGVNTPTTSSAGRLFDGIAALIGLYPTVQYEAQAAIALETLAMQHALRLMPDVGSYPLPLVMPPAPHAPAQLDWHPLLDAICNELYHNVSRPLIAQRFHNALLDAICAVALHVGTPYVALSGGCFQNRLLATAANERLQAHGFTVLHHRQLPPNDGALSVGQLMVAAQHVV